MKKQSSSAVRDDSSPPIYAYDVFILWRYLRHEGYSVDECLRISRLNFNIAIRHRRQWRQFVLEAIATYLEEWIAFLPKGGSEDRVVRLIWGEKLSRDHLQKLCDLVKEVRGDLE